MDTKTEQETPVPGGPDSLAAMDRLRDIGHRIATLRKERRALARALLANIPDVPESDVCAEVSAVAVAAGESYTWAYMAFRRGRQ